MPYALSSYTPYLGGSGGNSGYGDKRTPPGDQRLPEIALQFRKDPGRTKTFNLPSDPRFVTPNQALITVNDLSSFNITVWSYIDKDNKLQYRVNANFRKGDTTKLAGRPNPYGKDFGLHAEMLAMGWFDGQPGPRVEKDRVRQIFTERFPCGTCFPVLKNEYSHVSWYYFFDRRLFPSIKEDDTRIGDRLKVCYGLP